MSELRGGKSKGWAMRRLLRRRSGGLRPEPIFVVSALCAPAAIARGHEAADLIDGLVEALAAIRDMTNPDNPDGYRADDREGCLDTVFETACRSLKQARGEA